MNPIWMQHGSDKIVLGFPTLGDAAAWVQKQSNNVAWQSLWTLRISDRGEGMATCENPVAVHFDGRSGVVKGVEELSEESIGNLLESLDAKARAIDNYELGLPLYGDDKTIFQTIVREWFNKQ